RARTRGRKFRWIVADAIAFTVLGLPAPQGSKRHVGNGVLIESSKKVGPWRDSVVYAAVSAMRGREPFEGAVAVAIEFRLPQPKTVRRDLPSVRPDVDKLVRSTLDALTTAQVFLDDSQVCDLYATKRYGLPGATISVGSIATVKEAAA